MRHEPEETPAPARYPGYSSHGSIGIIAFVANRNEVFGLELIEKAIGGNESTFAMADGKFGIVEAARPDTGALLFKRDAHPRIDKSSRLVMNKRNLRLIAFEPRDRTHFGENLKSVADAKRKSTASDEVKERFREVMAKSSREDEPGAEVVAEREAAGKR